MCLLEHKIKYNPVSISYTSIGVTSWFSAFVCDVCIYVCIGFCEWKHQWKPKADNKYFFLLLVTLFIDWGSLVEHGVIFRWSTYHLVLSLFVESRQCRDGASNSVPQVNTVSSLSTELPFSPEWMFFFNMYLILCDCMCIWASSYCSRQRTSEEIGGPWDLS